MKRQIGDRVRLIKAASVKHFGIADMPITGEIVSIDYSEAVYHNRRYQIKFDDGRLGWYATDEIRKMRAR